MTFNAQVDSSYGSAYGSEALTLNQTTSVNGTTGETNFEGSNKEDYTASNSSHTSDSIIHR
ncbi:hypothetical protein N7495_007269 [Penicillium taxi]|uniref:uncharacterized protein n=1 Tax=Penicillium taxi TaxID=168475 RepID=UPI002544DADF|nr:uncharacterized protein N7495_007269 [Penicillium taxi]KAJ5895578.1 hypothetical protein N7495_007269 [Penicillium taxi]